MHWAAITRAAKYQKKRQPTQVAVFSSGSCGTKCERKHCRIIKQIQQGIGGKAIDRRPRKFRQLLQVPGHRITFPWLATDENNRESGEHPGKVRTSSASAHTRTFNAFLA